MQNIVIFSVTWLSDTEKVTTREQCKPAHTLAFLKGKFLNLTNKSSVVYALRSADSPLESRINQCVAHRGSYEQQIALKAQTRHLQTAQLISLHPLHVYWPLAQ